MKFKLEINTDNDAFTDDITGEIARILKVAALKVNEASGSQLVDQKFKVRDTNGNTVGFYTLTEDQGD